ncbi:hypothetical protein FJ872_19610 [Mesorhizobium sp. B2-5-9]|uniref:hypothetical protein n=1 Tax=Mesorhizobium sp. B2-5-9 TaxID=2589921 RepID=UPI00112A70CC|nr:hypothetical protein [Mesorhizobium sp. B2-5-9]TPK15204.1 hypothetical protein FJ872_19610 [Mesorhizobium sp. B2-5-9]
MMSIRQNYQRCKPVTDKNIGKRLIKRGKKNYSAGGGAKEAARAAKRRRQGGRMTDLQGLHSARVRLLDGEPIRILIGHAMHSALEIVPAAKFMADLRAAFLCDIDERISDHPAEGGEGDCPSGTFARPSAASGEPGRTSEGQN